MLRVKLAKLKQVCASAFIPRILQEAKTVKKDNFSIYSIEYLAKAKRSTDSGSKDKNLEERKRIIDKCFSEKTPVLEGTEQNKTEPKDKIKLHNVTTKERNKSFESKILEKNERDDVQRNAQVQSIVAQVEEVKRAHDINPLEKINAESFAAKSKIMSQVTVNKNRSEETGQIDTAPHLKSDRAKENVGTPKVSALLQNINVQTTAENVGNVEKLANNTANIDNHPTPTNSSLVSEALESAELEANVKEEKEKLVQQVVHIDKTPHVDIETDKTEDMNSTSRVSEESEKSDLLASKAEIEQEKLTQHVVHIDKTPLVNIDVEKEQNVHIDKTTYVDITPDQNVELNTTKVTESLGNAKVEAAMPKVREEKLSQQIVHVDKTPFINVAKDEFISDKRLSGLVQKSNIRATTAKIEEEKLAQKIDKVDETPHVEASVDKIEGFNTSPRILGHENTHTLSASEAAVDTTDQPEQVNLDELAKKCLGKPDGEIDQILLKELKNISRTNSIKFDFPKEDSVQKYFSQIFENKSKDNNNIVFDITNANLKQALHKGLEGLKHKEMGVDKFHPFHLDTVPVVTADTKDYDEDCKRNLNPDGFKNILLDIPSVLDPYDMQAIPFYQYVSKENIVLQELQVEPFSSKTKETEINAPMNEEVILRREEEEIPENNEIKELEGADTKDRSTSVAYSVKPLSDVVPLSKSIEKPTLSESDVSKLLEYKHVLSAQQEALVRMSPNIIQGQSPQEGADGKQSSIANGEMDIYPFENATHTVLTSATGAPTTPTDPFGNPINIPADQPKMEHERQPDSPASSAISAHQDPSEYFPTQHLSFSEGFPGIQQIDYEVADSSVAYTGVFDTKVAGGDTTKDAANDNLISQSAFYYSIFPQLAKPEEYSTYRKPDVKLCDKDHITQVFVQPQKKECPDDFNQKESKADIPEKGFQRESTREYVREEFVQPEIKEQDLQEEIKESEPKQRFRENIIEPESTREDIREEMVLPKRVEKVEASTTKDIEGIPISEETIPLSVLLRRVRERNRLELIESVKADIEMKNPACLPPLDKSKPKTTLQPKPCQPKPKEETKPPSPCKPPEKKDPCAKFVPFFLGTMFSDVSIPPKVNCGRMYTYVSLAKEMTFRKLKRLCQIFGIIKTNSVGDKLDVACARQFEPWVPIPSWPIPKIEKKRELVCPKDGCKLPVHPVRSNTDKPCLGIPKKISPNKTLINPLVIDEM